MTEKTQFQFSSQLHEHCCGSRGGFWQNNVHRARLISAERDGHIGWPRLPFRPLIADSLTITAFQKGELKPGHFTQPAAGCLFSDAGRKAFFTAYGRRMGDEITHPVFGYKLSYRRMLILHARMIAAWLNNEVPTLAFLTTR